MVPLWGRCTTQFRTYVSGIESDVHWVLTDSDFWSLTHGHLCCNLITLQGE